MPSVSRAKSTKVDPYSFVHLLGDWSDGDGPLYRQLARAIERQVREGTLRAGYRLPAERTVATDMAVSRGTVVRAYELLAESALVTRKQGSGTVVNGEPIDLASIELVGQELLTALSGDDTIDLRLAVMPLLERCSKLIAATNLADLGDDLYNAEPLGLWRLRVAIARHYSDRGLATTPHQIMVTNGSQQAASLTVQGLVGPGGVVLGEEDTWPGLINSVRLAGGTFEPVAMGPDGVDLADLEAKIRRYNPALIALVPQFHTPTGTALAPDKVAEAVRLSSHYRVPLLEDRSVADLSFDGTLRPRMADYDEHNLVLTGGSLNKVAWPGLRLGWLRADAQYIQRLRPHKFSADLFTAGIVQVTGISLLEEYDALLAEKVEYLRSNAAVAVEGLHRHVPEWEFSPPQGGYAIWAKLPERFAGPFCDHAATRGLLLSSCASFSVSRNAASHLRIPFTTPEPLLREAIRRVGKAWDTFDRSGPEMNPILL